LFCCVNIALLEDTNNIVLGEGNKVKPNTTPLVITAYSASISSNRFLFVDDIIGTTLPLHTPTLQHHLSSPLNLFQIDI
jgi:hypothetical protein